MLKSFFMLSLLALITTPINSDKQKVKNVATQFAQFADQQDVIAMASILNEQYHTYLNRLMGSTQVKVLDKTTYLQMLKDKKLGGDDRKITIESMDINGNNASVKIRMEGKKLNFDTYLLLAKSESGDWQIVVDMPNIVQK